MSLHFRCKNNSNTMVGFTVTPLLRRTPLTVQTPFPSHPPHLFLFPSSHTLKPQFLISPQPQPLLVFAVNNNNNNNNNEMREQEKTQEQPPTGSNGEEDANNSSKQRRPIFNFNLNTLLDPDPDNVLALGLTGLLTWASVQVLWQLLFISLAILVAALKYSFIAALLLFILITLL
ncbi:uncharacterized protein LOC133295262 [Gastrolobium bilobum]|uniref:uncharacterized protein LOC133295262 n=1 Tax=Gastrolobium bilobum TaxID=150636 RepID=UPI002AAF3714|nr:uncharacterized protein LOC133295262 [Gastrolobium bilobum]